MPVPMVIITTWLCPRPAPSLDSAQAAALASFSITTGKPVRSSTCRATDSFRQDRFAANRTSDRLSSTKPAAPIPTAATSLRPNSSLIASLIASIVPDGSAAGVGRFTISTILPSSSTTPAAILVPPTSTPMVRPTLWPFRLVVGRIRAAVRRALGAVCLIGLAGFARPVGQDRIEAGQRLPDGAGHNVGRVGEDGAATATAAAATAAAAAAAAAGRPGAGCPGIGDPPGRPADRTPGALWRLIGRVRRLRRH